MVMVEVAMVREAVLKVVVVVGAVVVVVVVTVVTESYENIV